ncbi:PAS domain-containing sensor histidine kinase [Methanobacterium oryzae]|uniref:PAS domain-containing sensor histidine kinase n=1 Tax=Methanobacterium oryzae TaxID=69540 RepID=UPI003D20C9BC
MEKSYESIIENRLKAFDNMLEGVAIHEVIYDSFNKAVDYIIIDINPAYEDITGLKKDEVLKKKASVIYKTDNPPYIDIYSKVAITGEPEHFEAYFEPMDKYFRIVVTSPEKGKFATFFEDISGYKNTEKKLKESEKKYRQIVETANEGIWAIDNNFKTTFVNQKMAEMLGYTIEEMIGKQLTFFMFFEDLDDHYAKMELRKKGISERYERRFQNKNGSEVWTQISVTALKDKNNNFAGSFAMFIDITERKKAEMQLKEARDNLEEKVNERTRELEEAYNALSESEEIYRKLLRESFDAWAIHSEGILLSINDSAAKIVGGNPKDLIGKPILDFVHPDYREDVKKRTTRLYEKGGSEPLYEEKFLKLDGKVVDVEVMITALTYKGKPAIQIVFRDITERKNAEKLLKESITELERSNKELQSFAYITSHDLQEPLRTMGSYAGLLKRRYEGQLDEDADDFLEFMVSGATRMKDMVQGLLDYSRVGTQCKFTEFNSEKALKCALTNLQSPIKEYHAEITYNLLPNIVANESQITRIFQNLISNAIKFRREGITPEIHISCRKEDNEYVFSVSDNGIGLEEQYSDRIFEVFKRLHAIGEYQGAGIGLAIAKRIIDCHNGRIWVKSKLGKGSTFYFTIPLNLVEMEK